MTASNLVIGNNVKVVIVGLGYVGLPLLCNFSVTYTCWGIDTDSCRIAVLTVQAYHLSTEKKLLQQAAEEDIVVFDLRLPNGDGMDLLRWMRKEGKMQPFIIMTDYFEVHTAVKSMKLGSIDYIPKQLVENKFIPLLRTIIKQHNSKQNRTLVFSRNGSAF